jgi:hypothetical protein
MKIPKDFSDFGEELYHVFITTKGARYPYGEQGYEV